MLDFPIWKKALIWGICLLGVLAAAPNANYTTVESANDARAAAEAGQVLSAEQQAALEAWPSWAPSSLVNLGLDLRGGAHLLVEVQVRDVYAARMEAMWPDVRDALKEIRDKVGTIRRVADGPEDVLRVRIGNRRPCRRPCRRCAACRGR